ncbi:MAG TPA: MFS transporter [Streptosporangiaceae bacterium]|nr:MFS transporter [Streptosporangiaceae bacterium]
MSATPPDTGEQAALNGAATREVSIAAASSAARSPETGAPPRRLGLALAVIATAQLMVVLDATIVNVALPHIQTALGFSGSNLEWVVNAYALAFGGLLLLGGRSGDLLGRRRIFIAGILLFTLASLLGGFATDQAWLLCARVLQGVGGAFAAPTALSLIAVNFPEGPPRNRAMGVYAAMSIAGGAVGLIAGGLLVSLLSWRWVFFVNVPIGLAVALLAPRVLGESERRRGRFDLPGAITGSLGLAALVYGLSSAATSPNGVSHWGDTKVIVSLAAAVVLLVTFGWIEVRSRSALVPLRVLRSRDRTGSYLVSLCIGTGLFGMFFFLTLFLQNVWGYSALRTGVAYLPMVAMIMVASGVASQLVSRIGARPLMIAGSLLSTGGMFWLAQITEHSHYVSGLLGPMMVTATGMGLIFVPLSLVALTKVANNDAGVASSLLNVGQQVGGALGLAVLGTVAWSAVANSLRSQAAAAAAAAKTATVHVSAAQAAALQKAASNHALAHGFSQGFIVSAGIMLLALIITLVTIRVTRQDLAGVNPMAAPAD